MGGDKDQGGGPIWWTDDGQSHWKPVLFFFLWLEYAVGPKENTRKGRGIQGDTRAGARQGRFRWVVWRCF